MTQPRWWTPGWSFEQLVFTDEDDWTQFMVDLRCTQGGADDDAYERAYEALRACVRDSETLRQARQHAEDALQDECIFYAGNSDLRRLLDLLVSGSQSKEDTTP